MKTFKFKVIEYGISGPSEKMLEVKARTESAALKKAQRIQGNREWAISLVGVA
jgi:hypothetical protein